MFSDTHFHFTTMQSREIDGVEILTKMAERNCFFGLDIGTHSDDLLDHEAAIENAISQIKDTNLANRARNFMYFSAGIWPDVEAIKNRENEIKTLREYIARAENEHKTDGDTLHRKIIAIGECGLDHHWNPSGVDGRCESDFDQELFDGEKEFFQMQLELAREMNLPIIVHSRDAFQDTYDVIKKTGYHNGIIHCNSYGFEEAKAFLDLGWYISFAGSVTYTKKSKMEEMHKLLNLVPNDRILCETDAPYLAPVPMRGNPNTPIFVEHTYKFVAEHRGVSVEELCDTVDANIKTLFKV